MKLFYQLSEAEQENAINHCADLVVSNAIDNGLQIEVHDDSDSKELKRRLDNLFIKLKEKDFKTKDEKAEFLMSEDYFADTIFELAREMAHNAFYHDQDELVIFADTLSDGLDEEEPEEKKLLPAPTTKKSMLN